MKDDHQHRHRQATQISTEPILFGGYEPFTSVLRLTVEASTVEEAQRRMLAVAPLVEIKNAELFSVFCMDSPSRTVPLFMDGFFVATRLGMKRDNLVCASGTSL